jgi:transcriptional regulator of NAD metabolism
MVTKKFKFKNGDRVRDLITKHEGIISGTCFYITGCNQYLVSSEQSDVTREAIRLWHDEQRLELVEPGAIVIQDDNVPLGADIPAPIR